MSNKYERQDEGSSENHIPIVGDEANLNDPMQPPFSNSDHQLGSYKPFGLLIWDEREAIDRSLTILGGDRLRHSKPQTQNKYDEGPGDDGLPDVRYGQSGRSATDRIQFVFISDC
ncbi:hypothetical protein BBP40_002417 [Aspergillus hancockii]|nr:hypothetical protein BBP40_002417 [Aspergillus hancockii]